MTTKVSFFLWELWWDHAPIVDNLIPTDLIIPNWCSLCKMDEESLPIFFFIARWLLQFGALSSIGSLSFGCRLTPFGASLSVGLVKLVVTLATWAMPCGALSQLSFVGLFGRSTTIAFLKMRPTLSLCN